MFGHEKICRSVERGQINGDPGFPLTPVSPIPYLARARQELKRQGGDAQQLTRRAERPAIEAEVVERPTLLRVNVE